MAIADCFDEDGSDSVTYESVFLHNTFIAFSPYLHISFIHFSCIFPLIAGTKCILCILGTNFISRKQILL